MPRIGKKLRSRVKAKVDYDAYYGQEPATLEDDFDISRLSSYLTWYANLSEIKKLKKYIIQYMSEEKYKQEQIEKFENQEESHIPLTLGSLCRMKTQNCPLQKSNIQYIKNTIDKILSREQLIPEQVKFNNHNNQLISDLEDQLDIFYRSNYKKEPIDFFNFISEKQSKTSDVKEAVEYYKPLLEELNVEQTNLSKKQLNSYIHFISTLINDCYSYYTNSKKQNKLTRKPRKKKLKSAEQLSAKVKFKQSDPKLKLTSVLPSSIVGSQIVWLFNTKYKKMTYLIAQENSTLSIKGTTILGFDEKQSITKTIRKPEKVLIDLLNNTKMAMVKQFLSLKTKSSIAKGRINEDVLILKTIK